MDSSMVWSIGGFDPSGHAGITVDNRTMDSFNISHAMIISAATAQNDSSCRLVQSIDPSILTKQVETLLEKNKPIAIKIGMIPDRRTLRFIVSLLKRIKVPTVFDPVMCTSSGAQIINCSLLNEMKRDLLPLITLITPNIMEAEYISGQKVHFAKDFQKTANVIKDLGVEAVLVKDGHGTGDWCRDYFHSDISSFWMWTSRLKTCNVRGTGCCLSSAIAALYAQLGELSEAVVVGTAYVKRAIRLASPLLHHGPWPVEECDMPMITSSFQVQPRISSFPECNRNFQGIYPVLPSSEWIKKMVDWDVKVAQLRIKKERSSHVDGEMIESINYSKNSQCGLYINDHWESAIKYGAYGVHLGQSDCIVANIGAIADAGLRLGVSTHSYEELGRALALNPSYIALGPIFPTTTKDMPWKPQGIGRIAIWKTLSNKPLVAIGGMNRDNASKAFSAGADAVACVRELTEAGDPEGIIKQWKKYELSNR